MRERCFKTTTYTFDDENRLVQVVRGSDTIIYAYDPLGRRIAKSFGDVVNWYVYDGSAIIAAYNSSGTVTARYAHGLNIDEPLAVQRGSATSFYHADGLGSIVVLTNAAGSVVQTYSYDAFGNITPSGGITQPYTYTAREYDYETGLYFYRARYYDPKAGRFISRDPISFDGGDVNLYGYVRNDPVNWFDPMGLYWFRQSWQEPGVVGRRDTPVPPRGAVSEFIERNVPAGYTFGEMHDSFVETATGVGFPDWLVNIPSMPTMYTIAVQIEILRALGLIKQPTLPKKDPCK